MEHYLNPWALEVMVRHPEISICDQWQFVKDDPDGLFGDWWESKDVHFRGSQGEALGQYLGQHVATFLQVDLHADK